MFSVFLISTIVIIGCKSLEIVKVNGTLPTARSDTRSFYDGLDSIYVLGGLTINSTGHSTYYDQVLKYNITSDQVSEAGVLPTRIARGGVGNNGGGTYYYLGGYSSGACSSHISQLTTSNPNGTQVGTLPRAIHSFATASDGEGNIYVVGGAKCGRPTHLLDIVHFDTTTNTSWVTGYLPPFVFLSNMPAVWIKESVYIFGGFNAFTYTAEAVIVKFSPNSGNSEILGEELPIGMDGHSAVAVEKYVYIIGGQGFGAASHQLSRFDSEAETIEVLEAVNFPSILVDASSVFVEKTNRIYIFGGNTGETGTDSADILYIQLD